MSFDPVTESEVMSWHLSQGGFGKRPAAHALRMLREMVELCVASGATEGEIKMAVRRECDKAKERGDFLRAHTLAEVTEEFVDVQLLATVFRSYFIHPGNLENMKRLKFDICLKRQWQPDADGVLWRPGTKAAGSSQLEPKSS